MKSVLGTYSGYIPLPQEFFAQDTVEVAKRLLGHYLIFPNPLQKNELRFKIVETEAYTETDPACHAYGRKTGRAATLYKRPGLAYVYLIYGMYHCLNVVTEPEGSGGAVLFRALEPVVVASNASLKKKETDGPGKLCRALGITRALHQEIDLTDPVQALAQQTFFLACGEPAADSDIVTTTRIGIQHAKEFPWRFYLQGNEWVSKK